MIASHNYEGYENYEEALNILDIKTLSERHQYYHEGKSELIKHYTEIDIIEY